MKIQKQMPLIAEPPTVTSFFLDKNVQLKVDENLANRLLPHQREGVKFMWDVCFGSVENSKRDCGNGCILAHCMGLGMISNCFSRLNCHNFSDWSTVHNTGKTFQTVTFLHALLSNSESTGVNRVLILSPVGIVPTWKKEFENWLSETVQPSEIPIYVTYANNKNRSCNAIKWLNEGGIFICGYEMFRDLPTEIFSQLKLADVLICDEGHMLKNSSSKTTMKVLDIKTKRKILLTGTPMQNNLRECEFLY